MCSLFPLLLPQIFCTVLLNLKYDKKKDPEIIKNSPTVLIKLHRTEPLPARAKKTFTMDLQHADCILTLYCGKLSICTTTRRSSTGVYTSGIYKGKNHILGDRKCKFTKNNNLIF